jgi:hypothetical protein
VAILVTDQMLEEFRKTLKPYNDAIDQKLDTLFRFLPQNQKFWNAIEFASYSAGVGLPLSIVLSNGDVLKAGASLAVIASAGAYVGYKKDNPPEFVKKAVDKFLNHTIVGKIISDRFINGNGKDNHIEK